MKNMIKLLLDNAAQPQAIQFAKGDAGADVYLKGVIAADYGIGAETLRSAFAQADGADITLHINSPGGDVFEAREMQGVIAGYSGKVFAQIEGVAASAATIVSMSANSVRMLKGSRYMIHNGWSLTMGDKRDHLAMADLLSGFDAELAAEYSRKTGVDASQVAAWMNAETWFTADQALQNKFVDQVIENTKNATATGLWNLSAYSNAPPPDESQTPAPDQAAILAANARRLRLLQIA